MNTHDLLLALAGHVDDDLLAWARELVAVGEDGRGIELVTAALVAGRVVLPGDVRAALVTAARAARSVLDADAGLPPAGAGTATPHVFTAPDASLTTVTATLQELLGTRSCRAWLASRRTPAGSASGPLPHPVVLVELDGADGADVLAHQLGTALHRAGVTASVEAYAKGPELPAYHLAALAAGLALDLGPDAETAGPVPPAEDAQAPAQADPPGASHPVPTAPPTVEPGTVAEVPPADALVAEPEPAADPDTQEDPWAWPANFAAARWGTRTSEAEPGPGDGRLSTDPGPLVADELPDAAADLPAGAAGRPIEPAADEPWPGRARPGPRRPEPRLTEGWRSRPAPLGGHRLFSAEPEPEPEPADDAVLAAAAGPEAVNSHLVEPRRVDLPPRAPRLAGLRDERRVGVQDAESPAPAAVIPAWRATPDSGRDPEPSVPFDLWTPTSPSAPATPDDQPVARTEPPAAHAGSSVRPRPRPRAVSPTRDPSGDPLIDPLSGPLLAPLLDPTFGDEPAEGLFVSRVAGAGGLDSGPRAGDSDTVVPFGDRAERPATNGDGSSTADPPRPGTRLLPTADPQPPAAARPPDALHSAPADDRLRPAPVDGPFGPAPTGNAPAPAFRPMAADAPQSPRPAHARGIPRPEPARVDVPPHADDVVLAQGVARADDIPTAPPAPLPAPVGVPPAPARPPRPAPADEAPLPPRPPRPVPAADSPATPRWAPAADSPATARPVADITAHPHRLPPLGTDGATATGGARVLAPEAGAAPLGEVAGRAHPRVASRRPGGRRRHQEGAHLAAAPDADPTTQALPEQPPSDDEGRPRPGHRHQLGPVRAEPPTPVQGEPVVVDPRLGLRPESLERLSSTDRALLARLQSELGIRSPQPRATPTPRPRPVRSDPPDIAG